MLSKGVVPAQVVQRPRAAAVDRRLHPSSLVKVRDRIRVRDRVRVRVRAGVRVRVRAWVRARARARVSKG